MPVWCVYSRHSKIAVTTWWWIHLLVIISTDILMWYWSWWTIIECLPELLIFIICLCPTTDNLKSKCGLQEVWLCSQIVSSVFFWVLVGKCFHILTQWHVLSLLISFINTFHRYFNMHHRYRIFCGIPSVYVLYSWKFPSAGMRIQPKEGTISLFPSIYLLLKGLIVP